MKGLLFIFYLAASVSSLGQTFGLSGETNLLTYEEIIKVDSVKADVIYNQVKEWIIITFTNSEKVIVGDNRPTLLKATYVQQSVIGIVLSEYYTTMTVKIKDGALKVSLDDIRFTNGSNSRMEPHIYKEDGTIKPSKIRLYEDIEKNCKGLTKSLSSFINKKSDW